MNNIKKKMVRVFICKLLPFLLFLYNSETLFEVQFFFSYQFEMLQTSLLLLVRFLLLRSTTPN